MAKLNSINKQDFFEIKIINFEHEGEDWAISQILFSHKRENLLSSIGSYFETLELKGLILNVKKLFAISLPSRGNYRLDKGFRIVYYGAEYDRSI